MSINIAKKLSSQFKIFTTHSPVNKLFHFQHNYLSSSSAAISPNQESFEVSYLINSCGLTPKHALTASKHVNFRNLQNAGSSMVLFKKNADLVMTLFKKHGFSDTQISNIVRKCPWVLLSDWEKTILPKLEYFASVGFSSAILIKFVATSPRILGSSLVNGIIPTRNFFKSLLLSDERTNIATRRYLGFGWSCDIEDRVMPNIKTLREFGVNESTILSFLALHPSVLKTNNDSFKVTVEKVKKMGFNPQQVIFVYAVRTLLSMSKSTWDKKVDTLKKWGWSEDDVYVAFSKNPWYMAVSENKMSSIMDMVINKSGFDPSDVVNWPNCLMHSFGKRVVPRCLFYQVLLERGVITERWKLSVLLGYSDKRFTETVTKIYKEAAPKLLKLYQEKLECASNEGFEV